jgi:hypothetical protein
MTGCEELRENLVAVARGEKVDAADERTLREHIESCPQCRRRMANEASSAAVPPPEVRAALMAEFRRQHRAAPIRRQVFKWVAVGGVAAAVVMALVWANSGPGPWRPDATAALLKAPVSVAEVPTVVPQPAEKKATGQAKAHPTRRPRAPKPVEESPEVATDFIEIPYAEPLRPEERADVFRIQVPRASMAVFGLPVSGGRLDSRITADVLMGEDGVVRAVRFVR